MPTRIITRSTPPAENALTPTADVVRNAPLTLSDFDQNMVNLRAAIDRSGGSITFATVATDIKSNGVQGVGVSALVPRADHVHPSDITRALVAQMMYIGTTAVAINRASLNLALTGILSVALAGATSGATTLIPAAVASGTITVPAATDTMALLSLAQTLSAKTLKNYAETVAVLATSGTLTLDIANGNVQSCVLSGAITIQWPTVSTAGNALSLTLYLTQPAAQQTIGFTNGTAGKLATDITVGGFVNPALSKRTMIVATSVNGSNWLYNQVWKEA